MGNRKRTYNVVHFDGQLEYFENAIVPSSLSKSIFECQECGEHSIACEQHFAELLNLTTDATIIERIEALENAIKE